jgi:hypothetical protein
MNRLFGPIVFLFLATAATWAQSTWRGQAEVWTAKNVPAEGFVAASNEFPLDTLLNVENYRTRKSIQVRVVAPLPADSSDLVLLSPKAAQALEIKVGEVPLVGVQVDPNGVDRPDNPDPDVNPLAQKPAVAAPPASSATDSPSSAPLPLPAVASPAPASSENSDSTRSPLAVADEPDSTTPATPGKKVFLTTKNPESETGEAPAAGDAATPQPPAETPAPSTVAAAAPADQSGTVPASPAPEAGAAPAPTPTAEVPAAPAPVALAPLPVKTAPSSAWVSVPSKLQGPVLGQVPVLASLEKGKPYVQLGSWASEAELLATLDSVKSYVPLALYKAEGQKNPWRIVVASAPKGQLGVLLMLFRSEGLRTATVVKG